MKENLATVYNSSEIESEALDLWTKTKSFAADPSQPGESFAVVIPPPNVTAALHLGHALNNTLQDIMIRKSRMQGKNTLWMPGTDHAGIATQTVVEKRILAEEGKRRTDFERSEFVGRVQDWKDEYEARIINQLKVMGCSCDWDRTRFTMDEVCAKAVREIFFRLYDDGLIYRGKRLVNWDPATQTVLADDEVEHETIEGFFWYLQYPLVEPVDIDGEKVTHITVATTRPETMLGDTGIAMNPSDPRADKLVGKKVRLPLIGREIPIVADLHVVLPDPESADEKAKFSTGFLKVTPAHDPYDWEIGIRHELQVINIMAPDGSISDSHGWEDAVGTEGEQFVGMDRFEARNAIVEWFRSENLLEQVREYAHDVGHSYRSHVPIEPYLSDQWYISVKKPIDRLAKDFGTDIMPDTDIPQNSLAGMALKPLMDEKLTIIPDRYNKNYRVWLENLRDWPISRQLWWGHQIPVWSKAGDHKNSYGDAVRVLVFEGSDGPVSYICVKPEMADVEKTIEADGWVRDNDVLDTWFSSALWPFSTLGWPDDNEALRRYYPGSVLCTAREIITLWVSRMVMMGQYVLGDIPFSDVFIHAMIQDGEGRKMSKSLGNGIDPLEIIDSHGADAMRFALASMTTMTQDVRMPIEKMTLPDGREVNSSPKFDIGRNFCNKMWNASRFAMTNLEDISEIKDIKLEIEDVWILSRLHKTIAAVTSQIDEYRFSDPINGLYRFFWNEVCDWYLELIKPRMWDDARKGSAQRVLAYVLDCSLRLLHPFLPYITEGIYQKLNGFMSDRSIPKVAELQPAEVLIKAAWPESVIELYNDEAEKNMEIIQNVIKMIREIRTKYQVKPKDKVDVTIKTTGTRETVLTEESRLVCNIAGLQNLTITNAVDQKPERSAVAVGEGIELFVHDVVDTEAELARLNKQKNTLLQDIERAEKKLNNENFIARANPDVVEKERSKLAALQDQYADIEKNLKLL
ncbi:MAG: valine--tRNA ligase [Spirochaetes bacterium]|jgi:valyl-tRNA synthetase|nr:valine--tRNA ligase [Spirochaetota bacterium]